MAEVSGGVDPEQFGPGGRSGLDPQEGVSEMEIVDPGHHGGDPFRPFGVTGLVVGPGRLGADDHQGRLHRVTGPLDAEQLGLGLGELVVGQQPLGLHVGQLL